MRNKLLAILIFIAGHSAFGTITNLTSGDYTTVNNAYTTAAENDTIVLPQGTWTWPSTLTLTATKGIKLVGKTTTTWAATHAIVPTTGVDVSTFTGSGVITVESVTGFQTSGYLDVLTDNPTTDPNKQAIAVVHYTGINAGATKQFTGCETVIGPSPMGWTGIATGKITPTYSFIGQGYTVDNTVILNGVVSPKRAETIRLVSGQAKTYQISGITFGVDTSVVASVLQQPLLMFEGNSVSVRMDHCHLLRAPWTDGYIDLFGPINGVFDHNVADCTGGSFLFKAYQGTRDPLDSDATNLGNRLWTFPAGYGGTDWFFVEDNYIINRSGMAEPGHFYQFMGSFDSETGGSALWRYNEVIDVFLSNHGTQDLIRGGRKQELYENHFHYTKHAGGAWTSNRTGGLVAHDNTFDGSKQGTAKSGDNRKTQMYPGNYDTPLLGFWDVRDASTGDFSNAKNPALTGDDAPITGSASSGGFSYAPRNGTELPSQFNGGVYVDSVVGTGSTNALLVDATITNWADNQWRYFWVMRKCDFAESFIDSNFNDRLVLIPSTGHPGGFNLAAGDHYQIRRVVKALDQAGLGASDLIAGNHLQTPFTAASVGLDVAASFTGTQSLNVKSTAGFKSAGLLRLLNCTGHIKHPIVSYNGLGGGGTTFLNVNTIGGLHTGDSVTTSSASPTFSSVNGVIQGIYNTTTIDQSPAWAHQTRSEPVYAWNNKYTPTNSDLNFDPFIGNEGCLQLNRDYYLRAPQASDGNLIANYVPFVHPHTLVNNTPVAPSFNTANTVTFLIGQNNQFTASAGGNPIPTISASPSPVPAPYSFTAGTGSGTGTLSGTPTVVGDVSITFTATNGVPPAATQAFTIHPSPTPSAGTAPSFTSASSTTFTKGQSNSFDVTMNANPSATISPSPSPLPAGISFAQTGTNKATLSGDPITAPATYPLTFSATNTAGSGSQNFNLITSTPTPTPTPPLTTPTPPGQIIISP